MNVLTKKIRGDADYIEVACTMMLSVVLGSFVMYAFLFLINNTVLNGVKKNFASEPSTTVAAAQFNIRTDQQPIISLGDRSQLAEIKAFYFEGIKQRSVINSSTNTVVVTVPTGTDISSMAPSFAISDNASITINGSTPQSGASVQNFTSSKTYTVIAESGRKVEWKVTVVRGTV